MATVTCPHCGGEHKAGTARCPKTGALLPKMAPADAAVGPGPEAPPNGGAGGDPFAGWEPGTAAPLALRVQHGQTVALAPGQGPVLLGRDRSSSPIASACGDNVSWRHAEVRWGPDGPALVDLGSTNGTYVNGRSLRPGDRHLLRPDDVVQLANDPPLRLTVVRPT